ncbi:MAG: hypothetical protein WCH57_08245 [Verrucomicrobiota bacterium]
MKIAHAIHFRLPFLFLATLLMPLPGRSQTPAQLPAGPLLARVPQNTRWEIKFTYGKGGDTLKKAAAEALPPASDPSSGKTVSSDPRLRRVMVIKTPEALYEETLTMSGDISRRWHYNRLNLEILQFGQNGFIQPLSTHDTLNELVSSYQSRDFSDLGWISASSFRGIKKIGELDCLFFSDEVAIPPRMLPPMSPSEINSPPAAPPPKVKTFAWIDAETRLPVRWQRESETRSYRFEPATPIPELPPEGKHLHDINTPHPVFRRDIRP